MDAGRVQHKFNCTVQNGARLLHLPLNWPNWNDHYRYFYGWYLCVCNFYLGGGGESKDFFNDFLWHWIL